MINLIENLCDSCIDNPGCRYDNRSPVHNCHDYGDLRDSCWDGIRTKEQVARVTPMDKELVDG